MPGKGAAPAGTLMGAFERWAASRGCLLATPATQWAAAFYRTRGAMKNLPSTSARSSMAKQRNSRSAADPGVCVDLG